MLNDREIKIKMSVDDSKVKQAFDNLDKYQGKASNGNYGTSAMNNATKAQGAMAKGWLSNSIGIGTLTTAAGPAGLAIQGLAAGVKAAGSFVVSSVKDYSTFQETLKQVQIIAGGTEADMKMLGDAAIKVGGSTSKGAQEMADAMVDFAKLGFTATETAEAMTGVVYAAEASGSSVETTAQIVATSLNVWHKSATEAESIADVLAKTSNETAADMTDLGYTIQYAGASASLAGASMEDLSAMAGIMADNGIRGSKAGTSLRTAFTNLIKPTDAAADALEAMGISLKDSEGQFRPTMDVIYELQDAVKGMSDAEILDLSTTLFGKTGAAGMSFILKTTTEDLKSLTSSLENSTGTAARQAAEMRKTISGQLDQIGDSIDAIKLKWVQSFEEMGGSNSGLIYSSLELINVGLDAATSGVEKFFEGFHQANQVLQDSDGYFNALGNSATVFGSLFGDTMTATYDNARMFGDGILDMDDNLRNIQTDPIDALFNSFRDGSKNSVNEISKLQESIHKFKFISDEQLNSYIQASGEVSNITGKTFLDIETAYARFVHGDSVAQLEGITGKTIAEGLPILKQALDTELITLQEAQANQTTAIQTFLSNNTKIKSEDSANALAQVQKDQEAHVETVGTNQARIVDIYKTFDTATAEQRKTSFAEIERLQKENDEILKRDAQINSETILGILQSQADSSGAITETQKENAINDANASYTETVAKARATYVESIAAINSMSEEAVTKTGYTRDELKKNARDQMTGTVESATKMRDQTVDKIEDMEVKADEADGTPITMETRLNNFDNVMKQLGALLATLGQAASWLDSVNSKMGAFTGSQTSLAKKGGLVGMFGDATGLYSSKNFKKKARGGLTSGVPLGMGSGATTTVGASARGVGTQLGQAGISQGGVISNEKGREVTMPIQNPTYMRPFAQAIAAELGSSGGNSQPVQVEVPLYINGAEFARATYNDTKDVDRRMTRISNRPNGKA